MTRKVRRNSTEIFLVGPVVATGGVANFGSALLTSASAAVAFLHDTAAPIDISSYTWTTASIGGTIIPGYYHLTLASAITSVVGPASIVIQNSTDYLPVRVDYQIIGSAPFDTMYSSAPNILTSFDLGLVYESAITSTDAKLRFECSAGLATDNNFVGLATLIEDISTGNSHPTWVASVSATNNVIVVNSTATFTPVAGDKVRVWAFQHPRYTLNSYDPPTRAEMLNDTQAVNVTKFAGVTIIGSGSADSLFRTAGT